MKKNTLAGLAALILAGSGHAALTFTTPYVPSDLGPDGNAFLYLGKLTATNDDLSTHSLNVTAGGWSFADLRGTTHNGGPAGLLTGINQGWGHASRWYLLEVGEATHFWMTMSPWDNPGTPANEANDARPGFVIFAGESINDIAANAHTYNNDGTNMTLNDGWDKNGPGGTRGLTFIANGFNTTGGNVTQGVFLSPGLYTIALGNIGDSGLATGNKGFNVTFAVPEPSSALLGLCAGGFALTRRRRNV